MTKRQVIVNPRQSNTVRKAEKLVKARYRLSQLAIKVITTVFSMISKDDQDFQSYILKIKDFKELADDNGQIGGSSYKALKDACEELKNTNIDFDDEAGFLIMGWIASAEYSAGAGEIEIEISRKLRDMLLQLKESGNYLNYELKNILPLRSTYVIRLYELLKHEYNKVMKYKPNTTAVVHEVEIDTLREDFKIPNSYAYKDIRVNIFEKAIKQFKEYTDIEISYEPSRKRVKKVLAVEFTIRANDGLVDYLKDLRTFILYMRKNYINQDIWSGNKMILSISTKGLIYDKISQKDYSRNKSQVVWEKWYEMAKKDELLILKQGKLF